MRAWMPVGPAAWARARSRFLAAAAILSCVGAASPGIAAPGDADYDAIPDTADNCILMYNPSQLDSDRDGFGNVCDGDFDNNGVVNANDHVIMQFVYGLSADSSTLAAAADLNGSGIVSAQDELRLRIMMGSAPGPSAFASGEVPGASGYALVSWLPPTERTDGSVLRNLAGYEIRFGNSAFAMDRSIRLSNPGLSTYLVDGLAPGVWYFTIIALDSNGLASPMSAIRTKIIS